jgi:AbrB family looped-hinge helix DNA binding protein
MDSEATSSLTSKGQVTIPKALRQQLGLARGSRVGFHLVGDHIEVRPLEQVQAVSASGFGMLSSQRPPVPVHFDPATETQRQAARQLIESGQPLFLPKTVALELEWVSRCSTCCSTIPPSPWRTGLRSGLDFADALHHASCRHGSWFPADFEQNTLSLEQLAAA